jgi:hypothetical protein
MPEVPMCIHCSKPIDIQAEEYVVTNKHLEYKSEKWCYAHVECQKKHSN